MALALAACGGEGSSGGGNGPAPPDRSPDYASVVEAGKKTSQIAVRDEEDPSCPTVLVSSVAETRVFREVEPDVYEEIAWEEIRPGATVEVWVSGDVALSCPARAGAEAVLVTAGG